VSDTYRFPSSSKTRSFKKVGICGKSVESTKIFLFPFSSICQITFSSAAYKFPSLKLNPFGSFKPVTNSETESFFILLILPSPFTSNSPILDT